MKSFRLIVSALLAFSLMLPVAVLANEGLAQQTNFTDQTPNTRSDQLQNNLLTQLINQEVFYQLDPASALKFSCNVASLSGTDLAQDFDQYAATAPDIQVALVVRF